MFLDCYMNAKFPEKQMSPSWEILRSITERKGGTLEATGNFINLEHDLMDTLFFLPWKLISGPLRLTKLDSMTD